jgi:magnesium-transporting ATPase (P-type)
MRRFLCYVLTSNVPELIPFLAWALSGGSIPLALTVMQILAIDLATDLLPALALGAERPSPRLMTLPPRSPDARLLDKQVLGRAYGFLGPIEAVGSMLMLPIGAALFFGWSFGEPLPHNGAELATLSAMVWAAIVLAQVANGFECRAWRASLFHIGPFTNRLLLAAIGFEVAMLTAFIYIPPLASVLEQRALTALQWLPILLAPMLLFSLEEARRALIRRRERRY